MYGRGNVITATGSDVTDKEIWQFKDKISNISKLDYMINDFKYKVLSYIIGENIK